MSRIAEVDTFNQFMLSDEFDDMLRRICDLHDLDREGFVPVVFYIRLDR